MNEATCNWRLMKTMMTQCHKYDDDKSGDKYVPFDESVEESKILRAVRQLMPDIPA